MPETRDSAERLAEGLITDSYSPSYRSNFMDQRYPAPRLEQLGWAGGRPAPSPSSSSPSPPSGLSRAQEIIVKWETSMLLARIRRFQFEYERDQEFQRLYLLIRDVEEEEEEQRGIASLVGGFEILVVTERLMDHLSLERGVPASDESVYEFDGAQSPPSPETASEEEMRRCAGAVADQWFTHAWYTALALELQIIFERETNRVPFLLVSGKYVENDVPEGVLSRGMNPLARIAEQRGYQIFQMQDIDTNMECVVRMQLPKEVKLYNILKPGIVRIFKPDSEVEGYGSIHEKLREGLGLGLVPLWEGCRFSVEICSGS